MVIAQQRYSCSSTGEPPQPTGSDARSDDALGALAAMPVLIVEDEAIIAWMLESLLEEMGFSTIAIAANGEDAVAVAKELQPGLIISDINLGASGVDGIQAAATMRNGDKPPVVFVSAYASAEARSRIESDVPGALLLRKPVHDTDLRRAIIEAASKGSTH